MWVILGLLALSAGRAEAKHVRYLGPHPVSAKHGGGYCYIESPHMHSWGPDRPALYQNVGEEYVFTGDPVPFGYEGERHQFYGHHPVVVEGGQPVYCLIDGPHFHAFAPPPEQPYTIKSGVAFYVGPIDPVYVRHERVHMVNAEYRPYVSFRPVVEVAPPPEWRGEVWVAGPSVEVGVPTATFTAPGVSVTATGPGVFVPPPPFPPPLPVPPHVTVSAPAPHVYVGAPPPPHVYVGAPAPVVVQAPGRTVYVEERHDNGRHNGWAHQNDQGEDGHGHGHGGRH
jgi:hypothetical protein